MTVRAVLFDLGGTLIFQAREPDRDRLFEEIAQQISPLLKQWHAPRDLDPATLTRELYDAVAMAQPDWRARGFEVDGPFIARGALSSHGIDATQA